MLKKKKENNEDVLETSCHIREGIIAEQCYDGKKVFFAVWDGTDVSYEDTLDDGILIKPIWAEEVQKRAILLPSAAEEYGTDEELDNDIKEFITTWLDIPEDVLQFAIWNIKRSWVYDRFHTLNYLRALGDTGMGKSRFLDTLGHLHYKPLNTSGATTAAPIFRIIEKWKGTLVMDEADLVKSDETQDIIKIINMGFEKGKYIMRCDKENNNTINFFDPYGPKILATRKVFQDKAVESRCITQVMKGTNKKVPLNLNEDFFNSTGKLRNKLLMWRFKNYFTIDVNKEIDLGIELEPRVRQIVNTFISLFGGDPKQLEVFKVFIQKHQDELIDERKNSFAGSIVESIYNLVKIGNLNISAQEIIDEGNLTDFKGNPMKPRSLSSQLKSLGFAKTVSKRVEDKVKRCVPLEPEFTMNLFKRFGYDVTVVTRYMKTSENNNKSEILETGGTYIQRNNGNTVTETVTKEIDSNQIKDNLFSLFAMEKEIEIQEFVGRFPEKWSMVVDQLIEHLKEKGEIMESKPGFIRLI